jgi:hypothetical protein
MFSVLGAFEVRESMFSTLTYFFFQSRRVETTWRHPLEKAMPFGV